MPSWVLTTVFVVFIGLLLYRRFRSAFGRQPLGPVKMAIRAVFLVGAAGVLLFVSHTLPVLGAAAAGLALGIALSFLGLRYTKLERTKQGVFYTPNRWLSIGVLSLVIGRLAARVYSGYAAIAVNPALAQGGAPSLADAQRSPWTVGMFFVMSGYYVAYYAHLWRAGQKLAKNSQVALGP